MKQLTIKQKEILQFLITYHGEHGYPPTFREIGNHFGFLWTASKGHLKSLERKGVIRINPSKSRGIEIIGMKTTNVRILPVIGKIRAGAPVPAFEDIETNILVDKALFAAADAFSLKVKGSSMIEAGIHEGDYVIVKPQNTIENGEIGVILIEDDATIKRVLFKNEKIILKPENRQMQSIIYEPNEVSIIGKVIGLIRKFGSSPKQLQK